MAYIATQGEFCSIVLYVTQLCDKLLFVSSKVSNSFRCNGKYGMGFALNLMHGGERIFKFGQHLHKL